MKVTFTATFTGEIEIDPEDEHFLQPKEDEDGIETEEFEDFDPTFALEVLEEDFRDDPGYFTASYSDRDGVDISFEEKK